MSGLDTSQAVTDEVSLNSEKYHAHSLQGQEAAQAAEAARLQAQEASADDAPDAPDVPEA